MAAPSDDYLNQAVSEVVAALTASPLFMASDAPDAPAEAAGTVRYVEDDIPETHAIPEQRLPHCGVIYLRHGAPVDETAGTNDYEIEIGIRLYNRGTDRSAVWSALQKAAAAITKITESENAGGRFNSFATICRDKGGNGIDTSEQGGFGAMLLTGIVLQITRPY